MLTLTACLLLLLGSQARGTDPRRAAVTGVEGRLRCRCGDQCWRDADPLLQLPRILAHCAGATKFGCPTELDCARTLMPPGESVETALDGILRPLEAVYQPVRTETCASSLTLAKIVANSSSLVDTARGMATVVLDTITRGQCLKVKEVIADFRQDLLYHYGDPCTKIFTKTGFERLLNDLKTPEVEKAPGEVPGDCSPEGEPRLKRAAISPHVHYNLANECFSPEALLLRFGQGGRNLTWPEFVAICPALVQQVVSGVCEGPEVRADPTTEEQPLSTLELYGYSSVVVLIISLCSLAGVLLIPLVSRGAYHYVMAALVGLAFGTMAGDSLLHLLPQILGLHDHDEGESAERVPEYLVRLMWLLGTVYAMFVIPTTIRLLKGNKQEHAHGGHGHSHIPDPVQLKSFRGVTESSANLAASSTVELSSSTADLKKSPAPLLHSEALCCGLSSLAAFVIVGDTLHNLADGLAVGAAFHTGLRGGLATALAVLCHELPHEFGDFAILVSTGMSTRRALILNFASSLSSFVGLYIGIPLSSFPVVRDIAIILTAAMFLYVAFAEMLPELKQPKNFKIWVSSNVGVLAGFGLLGLIAIFEDKIVF